MSKDKKLAICVAIWSVLVAILFALTATASEWTGAEWMKIDVDLLTFPAMMLWVAGCGVLCHKIDPFNPPKGATPKKEE
jgi:hypothetical protein